jgi:hypothetical protein
MFFLEYEGYFLDISKLRNFIRNNELRQPVNSDSIIKTKVENWSLLVKALENIDISQIKKDILDALFSGSIRLLKFFRKVQYVFFEIEEFIFNLEYYCVPVGLFA